MILKNELKISVKNRKISKSTKNYKRLKMQLKLLKFFLSVSKLQINYFFKDLHREIHLTIIFAEILNFLNWRC